MRTPRQQRALLLLNQYVTGAYEEMADKVVDMQWLQLQKLRDLCEAAMEASSSRHSPWPALCGLRHRRSVFTSEPPAELVVRLVRLVRLVPLATPLPRSPTAK